MPQNSKKNYIKWQTNKQLKNKRIWENKGQKVSSKQKKTQNSLKSHKLVKKVKKKML